MGDEQDSAEAEDEQHRVFHDGPGCTISDPGEQVADDEDEDVDEIDFRHARHPAYGADQRAG